MRKFPTLSNDQITAIGKSCRDAEDGNLIVGSFAAEMAGESYPFSRAMSLILFKNFTDLELGEMFVEWMEKRA